MENQNNPACTKCVRILRMLKLDTIWKKDYPENSHMVPCLLDLYLYIAGTIFGHFCNGAGRVQCKYKIFT